MHYVLVHGAWQGGWCWKPLVAVLHQYGHKVTCLDLPGHGTNALHPSAVSYDTYYQYLFDKLVHFEIPVILVAHSMSGILAAPLLDRLPEKISHLFLIAAYVAQDGHSLIDLALAGGPSEIPNILLDDTDSQTQRLDLQKARSALYHDCPPELADWAINQLQPQPVAPLMTPIKWHDSGKTRNKRTYVLCEEDRDVHPTTQRTIISQYPCNVVSFQSGHFPFLSKPEELATILLT